MGFLMALRVNTFQSCQNVVKLLQTVQQMENNFTANFDVLFCFFPIFILGIGRPRPSLHVLIYWFIFIISVLVKIWTVVGCCH